MTGIDTLPRTTPLEALHLRLGARMGEFAGYTLPLRYPTGIIAEHNAVREQSGLFDVSHMGQVAIEGPEAPRLISRLSPVDAAGMSVGSCKYGLLLNEKAGILDDFIVSRLAADRYLAVVNAANAEADLALFEADGEGLDVAVTRLPRALIAIQGPEARRVLSTRIREAASLSFMTGTELPGNRYLSATGYTGEDGFEFALPADEAEGLAEELHALGALHPAGLGARDSLRLEAGLCLHGQDLSEETNPYEARLGWCLPRRVVEAGGFRGDAALRSAAASPPVRLLAGLLPEGRAPVRAGTGLYGVDGAPVGVVSSGGFSPTLSRPIAIGYIAANLAREGTRVDAEVRGRKVPCKVAHLPFVQHRYWRATRK